MNWNQANIEHRCLICGTSDARLLRLSDGRDVRACDSCLRTEFGADWASGEEREPLPCEVLTYDPKSGQARLFGQGLEVVR